MGMQAAREVWVCREREVCMHPTCMQGELHEALLQLQRHQARCVWREEHACLQHGVCSELAVCPAA